MRLQAYMIHEGRTQPIKSEIAIPWIKKHCGKHIKALVNKKIPEIYRGVRGFSGKYGIIDTKGSSERKSANTSNHMTLLMDNLPSWKKYPKRSQSIICSTNLLNAQSYGSVHFVYPSDKCDMGIVPSMDVWDGFQKTFKSDIPTFNRFLKREHDISDDSWPKMVGSLERAFGMKPSDEYKKLKREWDKTHDIPWDKVDATEVIKEMAERYARVSGITRYNTIIYEYMISSLWNIEAGGKYLNIIDAFNMGMNPNRNDFKLNSLKPSDKDNEVWIGNAPVFVVNLNERLKLEKEGML